MAKSKFKPLSPEELEALLPSYTVIGLLSKDRKGAVYQATETAKNLSVAIKVIAKEDSDRALFREYFQSQLEGIQKLQHPNIVQVYDFGIVEETAYIISEYVDGNALSRSTKGEAVDAEKAVELVLEIGKGLSYAHSQGIAHTDIKPQKIFLNREARPLLANFGSFSQIRGATGKPDFGSPGYAARETLAGTFDFRSDIYSLGVVFYELLTGELPSLPYRKPSEFDPTGPNFDDFLAKALDSKLAQRHQTVEEFAKELAENPTQPVSSSPQLLVSNTTSQVSSKTSTTTVAVKSSPFPSALIFLIAAAILIGVGTLIFAMTRSSLTEGADSADSSTQSVESKQGDVSKNRIASTSAKSPERQEERLADKAKKDQRARSLGSTLESQFPGVWSREDDPSIQARFNTDGSAERLDISMKGSWKVENDLIIVTWMRASGKLVIDCRIDPSEPDVLLVLQGNDRVRDRLRRTE